MRHRSIRLTLLAICLAVLSTTAQTTDKKYLLGKFNPSTDGRFTPLRSEHSNSGGVLRKEAYLAFIKMAYAAQKERIKLVIISSTRDFISQKRIWEAKWNGKNKVEGRDLTTVADPAERAKMILRYSSMPGSSRHHWGTDMDLNSLENGYFESGEGLRIYNWLVKHASEYGFCQPYTTKTGGRTGYEEEKWHWSYLPLAKGFLEDYLKTVEPADITGFNGSDTAESVKIIQNYVAGVSCK